MTTCAVCQLSDGLVINLIVAEPTDPPPSDCELVVTPTESGSNADIGWRWTGIEFVDPVATLPE
jgi:hypothetical protein